MAGGVQSVCRSPNPQANGDGRGPFNQGKRVCRLGRDIQELGVSGCLRELLLNTK